MRSPAIARMLLSVSSSLIAVTASAAPAAPAAAPAPASSCIECHRKITPGIVSDWELSKHRENGVECSICHGDDHQSAADVGRVQIPTPSTCEPCHEARVKQFSSGKHAAAWVAMNAMPTIHYQPMELIEGKKGCGGCHKIGLKSAADIAEVKKTGTGFGVASCDACHTRHTFSVQEARQPQACQTCHQGFDHAQWEMYSTSKHGVRALLRQSGTVPATISGPTCQTCHMVEGNHAVRTAWGFLAVRLPMPQDKQWTADRTLILQALGVLDPTGKPTARLDAVKAADIARLTQEGWQAERDQMLKTCNQCHSGNFARSDLEKGDELIRRVDRLMAQAIEIVAALYKDGVLAKPKAYSSAFPDLLTFFDAPTEIEQRLFVMFLEHRMRAFQGSFHANPDYALWYGWNELQQDLTAIREMAADLRARSARLRPAAAVTK